MIAHIQAWVDSVPSDDEVLAILEDAHVPCAPVLSIRELVEHPHMQQRGTMRTVEDAKLGAFTVPGMPLRFSEFPHNVALEASHLGADNAAILGNMLGYDAARIAALQQEGILFSNPET